MNKKSPIYKKSLEKANKVYGPKSSGMIEELKTS